jgi:hypothetical protein
VSDDDWLRVCLALLAVLVVVLLVALTAVRSL